MQSIRRILGETKRVSERPEKGFLTSLPPTDYRGLPVCTLQTGITEVKMLYIYIFLKTNAYLVEEAHQW